MSDELTKLLEKETLRETIQKILVGLKAPKDSGEYRYAKFALMRLLGPGAISVGLSAIVVIALFTLAVGQAISKDREIEVTVVNAETVKLDDIIEEIKPEEVEVTEQEVDVPVVVPGPPAEYSTPSEVPGVGVDGDMDTPMVAFAPVMTKSPLVFKGLYGNRTKGGREKALRSYGGRNSGAVENSVLRALRWLKEHQCPDGSWPGSNPAAMTGLALLTFLAHGETPASQEFGATVEKGLRYLIKSQNDKGEYAGRSIIGGGAIDAYAQAIATYAMSEGFALTKIMPVKESMEKALQRCIEGQQDQGGFFYGYGKDKTFDTSVAGWQIQAMKAAKMAGSSNPDLEKAIRKSIEFMRKQAFAADGSGFVYQGVPGVQSAAGGNAYAMTGIGTLCLQLLGQGKCPEVRRGLELMEPEVCKWPEFEKDWQPKGEGDGVPVYKWYYTTQAKFQAGGKDWKDWNDHFAQEIMRHQEEDGHWEKGIYDKHYAGGTWVYTTTLCALTLQVYYRYLPTYQHVEEAPVDNSAATVDDVVVKVL